MKHILKEFRDFAIKGNVIDLAVGVIIGASFGRIVSSLVDDLVMPPISLLLGTGAYAEAAWVLRPAVRAADGSVVQAAVLWRYGHFLQTMLEFLIVAFCIFLLVRLVNRFHNRLNPAEAPLSRQEQILSEIRDALRKD